MENQYSIQRNTTNQKNLQQLIILRSIAICFQLITIAFVSAILKIDLPISSMLLVIFFLIICNVRALFKLRQTFISDINLFLELLIDVGAFALQIYFSGGASNPFISLFLLQVIIAIILLKPLFYWIIAIITCILYVVLSKFYYNSVNLDHHSHHHADFDLHLQGMLISYVISALLLIIFIGKIIKNIRLGEQKIHLLEQQSLKEKQFVEMGLFATNSAHNLSTPLSTILLVINDWKKNFSDKNFDEDLKLIEKQIFRCKNILSEILNYSGAKRVDDSSALSLRESCLKLVENWHNYSQTKNLHLNYFCDSKLNFFFDKTLTQAIYNIFDNAFEAYKDNIAIQFENDKNHLIISVIDDGLGFDKQIIKNLGKPNLSSKNGNGVGLYLTISIIERIGGNFIARNLSSFGSLVQILIPLNYEQQ